MSSFKLAAHPLNHKGLLGAFSVLHTDVFCVLSVIETMFKIAWEKKAWLQGLKKGFIRFRIWCLSYSFFSELLQIKLSVNSVMFILKRDLFNCRMFWQMLFYQHSIGFWWLDTAPSQSVISSALLILQGISCWELQESWERRHTVVPRHSSSFWHPPS